jgi:hypothetical protein
MRHNLCRNSFAFATFVVHEAPALDLRLNLQSLVEHREEFTRSIAPQISHQVPPVHHLFLVAFLANPKSPIFVFLFVCCSHSLFALSFSASMPPPPSSTSF